MSPDLAHDPDVVWHYTDGAGLISILQNHVLWSTASAFLNDRQEVELGAAIMGRRLRERAGEFGLSDEQVALLQERHQRREGPGPGTFFILSASRDWDSLAMWRCYGGHGESYAIGLDQREPLLVLGDPAGPEDVDDRDDGVVLRRRAWAPVRYDPEGHLELVDAVYASMPEKLRHIEQAREAGDNPHTRLDRQEWARSLDDLEQALLLIKHQGFRDEREVRLATILYRAGLPTGVDPTATFIRYRATGYGVAPYLCLTGADPADRQRRPEAVGTTTRALLPVRGVAISPSPNGEESSTSVAQLLTSCGYPKLPILRSQIPFRG